MRLCQVAVGRRVQLILPMGLEKRIIGDLMELAVRLNASSRSGPRLLPVPGEVFTEIEALRHLCGARAEMMAAGGVGVAEGAVWLACTEAQSRWQSGGADERGWWEKGF